MRNAGVPEPPPLRSAQHSLGLPNLSLHHQRRVDGANALYRLAIEILVWCHVHGIIISSENPANGWLWAAFVALALEHSLAAAKALGQLQMVLFHACCHGPTRRKNTGWLSTPGVYDAWSATCKNDHPHEPWGVKWQAGSWVFDISAKAQYPHLLAQRATACLVQFLTKHRPLVTEYHRIVEIHADEPAPENSKQLPPHVTGVKKPEEDECTATRPLGEKGEYGTYYTPKQFQSMAAKVKHPMGSTERLEDVTKWALDFVFKYPAHLVEMERRKNLLQAKLLAAKLAEDEKTLHDVFPPSLRKILEGKNLLVWKALLEKYGYDNLAVVRFMQEGVELVGVPDAPFCYPAMLKPATLTLEVLQLSSAWRRRAVVGKASKADLSHVEHLQLTAIEELQMGFVEGPFHSGAEVSAHLGREDWSVVRRFVLIQGAEMELRPIYACREARLNQACTVPSYLKLQDIDYIAGLALGIAERLTSGGNHPAKEAWLGKCLDLSCLDFSKAYKRMAVHPDRWHLAVTFCQDIAGRPKYYIANSLMFGSTAAVYNFNRVSQGWWFLLNKMLAFPCGVFYDDCPMFQPESLSEDANLRRVNLWTCWAGSMRRRGQKRPRFKASSTFWGLTGSRPCCERLHGA